jgi:hypothetical protein
MRRLLWLVIPAVVLVPFLRLVAQPGALIVDPDRPSVDRNLPAEATAIGNDLTRLFLPHHAKIAREIGRNGHVPGWDPSGFGGRPLVGNPQAGLWYPPIWIAWKSAAPAALGWLTIAHLAFGGIGVFVLCRSLRIPPFAAMVAACLWCTAPYVLAQTYEGHYPHVWAASYQPWAFWAALGWRNHLMQGWLLPPILALSILTGHVQETYYLGLALACWLVIEWGMYIRTAKLHLNPHRVLSLAAIFLLTLSLVAIEIVPDMLARSYTLRRLPPTSADASKYHLHLINALQLVSPLALGGPANYRGPGSYWESLLSIGFVPLILVGIAVLKSKRRRLIRGWLALAILTILFSFGRGFGVFNLLFAIVPGMGFFRVPSRALFLTTLAASVLVGLGVETIGRTKRGRRTLAIGLGLLAILETSLYGFALIRVSPPERFLGPDPVGRAIFANQPSEPFRIRARDAFYGDARAAALGIEKTNINDSFQIGFAADLYERLYPMFGAPIPVRYPDRFRPELQADILSRMNVELLVSDRDEPRLDWPVSIMDITNRVPFMIWKNPNPLPRAYVVPRAVVLGDGPATVDEFTKYPAREFVIMTRDPMPNVQDRQPFRPAEYVSTQPDRVEVRVTTTKPGLLVVADTWMPGWSAEDNGRSVPILRGNRAQRVVVLATEGTHRIVMSYVPPGLAVGRRITFGALIVWIVGFIAGLFSRQVRIFV